MSMPLIQFTVIILFTYVVCVRMSIVWCEAKYYKKQNGFLLRKCVYVAFLCKITCNVTSVDVLRTNLMIMRW